MMIQAGLLIPKTMEMETDAFSQEWRSVRALDCLSLGRNVAAVGWHLFFIAGNVTTIAYGRDGQKSLRRAVERVTGKIRERNFNCIELTDIVRKHFWFVSYVLVSAHPCHIQEGRQIQDKNVRKRLQRDADQVNGSGARGMTH